MPPGSVALLRLRKSGFLPVEINFAVSHWDDEYMHEHVAIKLAGACLCHSVAELEECDDMSGILELVSTCGVVLAVFVCTDCAMIRLI